ncbi:MAG: hypothetical protein AAF800_04070 [Planctomycetota bacterium]
MGDRDTAGPMESLPEADLRHLRRLTDMTGIAQHAVYATPDPRHGYCIDDNARALIAVLWHAELRPEASKQTDALLHTYLMFLSYAFNEQTRRFRNFMGFERNWLEDTGSHDSQGRGLWAAGLTAKLGPQAAARALGREVYGKALPGLAGLAYPRSWAFGLLGIDAVLDVEPGHGESVAAFAFHAGRLFDAYHSGSGGSWPWCEDVVTYDNAKLPQALLVAGRRLGDAAMLDAGRRSLRWLLEVQTEPHDDGKPRLSVIGNDGWLRRGGPRAAFDQQPLEAYALVEACLVAARMAEGDDERTDWERSARMSLDWFLGRNDLGASLVDDETGGGRDGLQPGGVNQNQGAESTLAWVLSVLAMRRYAAGLR